MPSDLVMLDAVALSAAIKSKQVSCAEVMMAYVDHIERFNPRVNAIVSLQDRAALMKQARYRDEQLARGDYLGWMHGFPHAIKDLEATAGIRTTMGSPLLKNFVPSTDSIVAERIKRAGAIIVGKTNVPEFGLGSQTYNPVFGPTLNAFDQSKTPGGSSGGAAVGLATRMLPVADGSDHAGSLRNPAAFSNVFGFRTSFGRVPIDSPDVFMPSLSVAGPMARNVRDLAMLLSILAGYDSRTPLADTQDPAIFASSLERDFTGTRIAWLGNLRGYLPFEPGVLELCRDVLGTFTQLGCIVEEAVPEFPPDKIWQSWLRIRAWQVGARLKDLYSDPTKRALMKPEVQWEIENGLKLGAYELSDACAVRSEWYQVVRGFFETYDYFIIPSAQVFPFDTSMHWPREVNGIEMDTYHRWMEVTIPVTMSGCPALAAPAGFNAHGLPMGFQIVGPNHGELACLQLAHAYDQASGWTRKVLPAILG